MADNSTTSSRLSDRRAFHTPLNSADLDPGFRQSRVESESAFSRSAPWIVLGLGLIAVACLYCHNLGRLTIAQWDELMHVNVTHNLYVDPSMPVLHTKEMGAPPTDWTGNHVWLHKPLLPFYVRVGFYQLFGESLFTFRLPSVIFALLTAVVAALIVRPLTNAWTAVVASLLFATNTYLFEFVQGRAFSDFCDVLFIFFLTLILWKALPAPNRSQVETGAARQPTTATLCVTVALFAVLGYFCKAGLVLSALGTFGIAVLWEKRLAGVKYLILTGAVFLSLVGLESSYWARRFPVEFMHEQSMHLTHLFADIDGWSKPWDYYFSVYWAVLFGPVLAGPILAGVVWAFRLQALRRPAMLLLLWMGAYVLPLTFGVCKVANFVVALIPAGIVLLALIVFEFWRRQKWADVLAITATVIGTLGLLQLPAINRLLQVGPEDTSARRLTFILGSLAFIAVLRLLSGLIVARLSTEPGRLLLRRAVTAALMFAIIGVLGYNVSRNWNSSNRLPDDYPAQLLIQKTAAEVRDILPANAVMLVDDTALFKANLFFQYWSGLDSAPESQRAVVEQKLPDLPLYLISSTTRGSGELIRPVAYGYLYKLR